MRLLYFTDSHISIRNPEKRKDRFHLSIRYKFEEVGRLVKEKSADCILHGGDWFDRPDAPQSLIEEFAEIIAGFGKTVYTITGNHDIFEDRPQCRRTALAELLRLVPSVCLIDAGKPATIEHNAVRIILYGYPFTPGIDSGASNGYYMVDKSFNADYTINMVHGMLLDEPYWKNADYTLLEDIEGTGADLTLSGHYHSGFGIIERNGRYFANPGSLARMTDYPREVGRFPKVLLIDAGPRLILEELVLSSAKPGSEVF